MKKLLIIALLFIAFSASAQRVQTPEKSTPEINIELLTKKVATLKKQRRYLIITTLLATTAATMLYYHYNSTELLHPFRSTPTQ